VSQRYARVLVAGCAAVLAATAGATIALAAATWTVRPGGAISLKSGDLTVRDTRTGTTVICASSVLKGTLTGGTGLPGAGIGSVTAADITPCGSLGSFRVTAGGLPWHVNFSSYNATTGVVTGSVSRLRITVSGGGSPDCHAPISGPGGTGGVVKFTYADSTGRLTVLATGGNLHFGTVDGCAGLFQTGDPVTLRATVTVTPKQAITSP
jgi:hypothetical protein